jgi:hypothetical protein
VGAGQGLDFRLAYKVMNTNIKDLDRIGEFMVVSHEVALIKGAIKETKTPLLMHLCNDLDF